MIVLDEQLLGRKIELEIAKWYQGAVRNIIELRPHTVIKDDAIPGILRQQSQPIFVTINEKDFWRKVTIDNQYCIVCFTLPDSRVNEIPETLKSLLRITEFNTKAKRKGKVIRVTDKEISYYTFNGRKIKIIHDF
jgi:hypothetical protein